MDLIVLFLVWIVLGSVVTVVAGRVDPDSDLLDDAFFKTLHTIFWPLCLIYYFVIGIIFLIEKAYEILEIEIPRLYREWKTQQGWK